MSGELTKEQLLEYVKKQKLKIKKLEAEVVKANTDITALTSAQNCGHSVVNGESDSQLKIEIESLSSQLDAKTVELFQLTKKLQLVQESHEQMLLENTKKVDSSEQEIAQLRSALNESTVFKTKYEDVSSELALFKDALKAERESFELELSELKQKLITGSHNENEANSWKQKYDESQSELTNALTSLATKSKEVEQQINQNAQVTSAAEALASQKETELIALRVQLEQFMSTDSDAGKQLQDMVQQNEFLQTSLAALSEEVRQSSSAGETKERELAAALEEGKKECAELVAQCDAKEAQLLSGSRRVEELLAELQAVRAEAQQLQQNTAATAAEAEQQVQQSINNFAEAERRHAAELLVSKEEIAGLAAKLLQVEKELEASKLATTTAGKFRYINALKVISQSNC